MEKRETRRVFQSYNELAGYNEVRAIYIATKLAHKFYNTMYPE